MSTQNIDQNQTNVNVITESPKLVIYKALYQLIHEENGTKRAILVKLISDALDEYQLQNNSTIL